MKKTLLSAVAIATSVFAGMANEYTFVFDGNNDMGDLKRQTSTKEADLTFSDSFVLTEDGINFTLSKTDGTGKGYALVNAGGTDAGIYVSSGIASKIEMTVPNGKITAARINMTGYSLPILEVSFNGKLVESINDLSQYYWPWSDAKGTETLTLEWPSTFMARYIHSIEVTYTPDLGGKQECSLSFSEKRAEGVLGENFVAPVLTNPNNLPINWSSSDENVASINEDGVLTIVNVGTTVITASTEGNDEYAAGNAKYQLTVIPSAQNLAQMKEMAPDIYDRVKANFPVTVTFANGSYAYVIDSEGNAGYIHDLRNQGSTSTSATTIYKIGNVIPAGWIATNATIYESLIWDGRPGAVTENVEVVYPEVTSVTREDADRVVILKNVIIEKCASGNTKAYGETPDGQVYEFQDTYDTPTVSPGTYDVTVVVKYSKVKTTEYFYLVPLAYKKAEGNGIKAVDAADVNDGGTYYYDLSGKKISNLKAGVYVKVINDKAIKVIIK